MNVRIDRVAILLVVVVFVSSSVYALSGVGGPITMGEAIAMSRRSSCVRRHLSKADRFSVYAVYYNSSEVDRLRDYIESFRLVTAGHSVWDVSWSFDHYQECYSVSHTVVIDGETGEIIADEEGVVAW